MKKENGREYWENNKTRIRELFADETVVLKEIIREFTENGYALNLFGEIEQALNREDYVQTAKLAHKLKGSFSYFEVELLAESLHSLERYAKEQDRDRAREIFQDIKKYYRRLHQLLEELKESI